MVHRVITVVALKCPYQLATSIGVSRTADVIVYEPTPIPLGYRRRRELFELAVFVPPAEGG